MLPLIDNEVCNQPSWHNGTLDDSMVCAGYEEGQLGNCHVSLNSDLNHYLYNMQPNQSRLLGIAAHNQKLGWIGFSRAIWSDCQFFFQTDQSYLHVQLRFKIGSISHAGIATIVERTCSQFTSSPVRVRSILIRLSVGLSVCPLAVAYLRSHRSKFLKIFCSYFDDRGSVLLWRQCKLLCCVLQVFWMTSRFHVTDVGYS